MRAWLIYLVILCGTTGALISCKSPGIGQRSPIKSEETGLFSYSILVRLQDNGAILNEVLEKIRSIAYPVQLVITGETSFYGTLKELFISTEAISESRANRFPAECLKLAGVFSVGIYKN